MANTQTEASRYMSKYGGNNITPANYIVEMICERLALKDKLGALPMKFWALPKWKKTYMMQLLTANSLLKLYSPQAIIAGLRKHPKVYSLRAAWLDDTFKEEQEKVDKMAAQMEEISQRETLPAKEQAQPVIEKPRESFSNNKSVISKLRDLD